MLLKKEKKKKKDRKPCREFFRELNTLVTGSSEHDIEQMAFPSP
jgi:hypothetical protein